MIEYLRELLWDKAVARSAGLALLQAGGVYLATPKGRSEWERVIPAVLALLGTGGAALSWRPPKEP